MHGEAFQTVQQGQVHACAQLWVHTWNAEVLDHQWLSRKLRVRR